MTAANAGAERAEQPKQAAIRVEPEKLFSINAKEYLIRFGFGFLISVVAAVIGQTAGPKVGGLFLAFPAILPATLTLVQRNDGIGQALSDIRGATLGAIGMVAFAVIMVVAVRATPVVGLIAALLGWVVVSGLAYLLMRGLVKLLGEKQYLPEIPTSDAARFVEALQRKGLTIATAESCTGGMVSALLCAAPDAGRVVCGGVTAYSDDLKVALLGVSPATLSAHGGVSAEVAAEMAVGVQRATRADVAIAITGATVGATEGKPAGLTFVAVAGVSGTPTVRRFGDDLGPGRNDERAVRMALQLGECIVIGAGDAALPGDAVSLAVQPATSERRNQ
jgi:nicotinamide-nucleotide amidase